MDNPIDLSQLIRLIRGRRVMLSADIAGLYDVSPGALVQAVKRNQGRFPDDFLFQLTQEEFANLKSQTVISSWGGLRRAYPYAFTEQGVAMLSSVLRSEKAIRANILIMRAFVKIREMGAQNREILKKLAALEKRVDRHDTGIAALIDAIREDVLPAKKSRRQIGFAPPNRPGIL